MNEIQEFIIQARRTLEMIERLEQRFEGIISTGDLAEARTALDRLIRVLWEAGHGGGR